MEENGCTCQPRPSGEFYVYIIQNPLEDNIVCYVGKGKGKRVYSHRIKTHNLQLEELHVKCKELGIDPPHAIAIMTNLTEQDALAFEKSLISKLKRQEDGGSLFNKSSGGGSTKPPWNKGLKKKDDSRLRGGRPSGTPFTEEQKEQHSQIAKKAGFGFWMRGRKPWNSGKTKEDTPALATLSYDTAKRREAYIKGRRKVEK